MKIHRTRQRARPCFYLLLLRKGCSRRSILQGAQEGCFRRGILAGCTSFRRKDLLPCSGIRTPCSSFSTRLLAFRLHAQGSRSRRRRIPKSRGGGSPRTCRWARLIRLLAPPLLSTPFHLHNTYPPHRRPSFFGHTQQGTPMSLALAPRETRSSQDLQDRHNRAFPSNHRTLLLLLVHLTYNSIPTSQLHLVPSIPCTGRNREYIRRHMNRGRNSGIQAPNRICPCRPLNCRLHHHHCASTESSYRLHHSHRTLCHECHRRFPWTMAH